jgi:hypothetical protein
MIRRTVIVEGPLAFRMRRIEAAQRGEAGVQILTLPQVAARLAGGFIRPARSQDLDPAIRAALETGGFAELERVRQLPGTTRSIAWTLAKVWQTDLGLADLARGSARLADLAEIERRIRANLAAGVLTPRDLRDAALKRGLRQLAREAEERPAQREAFRQLHLNVWLDGAPNPAFDLAVWDEGAEELDISEFDGAPCWIAVDLSKTTDLTAVVACFLDAQGRYVLVPHFFVPEAGMRRRSTKDKVPYVLWAEQKLITPTPGDVVDLDRVEHAIRALCERHEVQEIAMDPWGARPMINRLLEDGLPVTEMRQGFATMSPATKEFERALLSRRSAHSGHAVLRWCVGNVVLDEDAAGNVKPNKARSPDRIDGAVAAIMALARAAAAEHGPSIYDDAEARPEGFVFI